MGVVKLGLLRLTNGPGGTVTPFQPDVPRKFTIISLSPFHFAFDPPYIVGIHTTVDLTEMEPRWMGQHTITDDNNDDESVRCFGGNKIHHF